MATDVAPPGMQLVTAPGVVMLRSSFDRSGGIGACVFALVLGSAAFLIDNPMFRIVVGTVAALLLYLGLALAGTRVIRIDARGIRIRLHPLPLGVQAIAWEASPRVDIRRFEARGAVSFEVVALAAADGDDAKGATLLITGDPDRAEQLALLVRRALGTESTLTTFAQGVKVDKVDSVPGR
jgi:hypothetical protein